MSEFTFTVYGKVRGQGRPKTSFAQRRVYKSSNDRAWESKIKNAYINEGGIYFGSDPLEIIVETHRALPKSTPKRIQSEPDIHKPDASNILKSIEDALNGIAYEDDKQIVGALVRKMPRERVLEHIVITIRSVK